MSKLVAKKSCGVLALLGLISGVAFAQQPYGTPMPAPGAGDTTGTSQGGPMGGGDQGTGSGAGMGSGTDSSSGASGTPGTGESGTAPTSPDMSSGGETPASGIAVVVVPDSATPSLSHVWGPDTAGARAPSDADPYKGLSGTSSR